VDHFFLLLSHFPCPAQTKLGKQCKHRCVIGVPFCYTHLLYKQHLRIKKSTLPNAGLGLFAVDPLDSTPHIVFKKGKTITKYFGEMIDVEESNDRCRDSTAPFAIEITHNLFEDGATKRVVGAIANTKPYHNNATISIYQNHAQLKATKNIYHNEEIFLSYGRAFRLVEDGVSHKTTK
jgi:hypothetical protein